jgi:hypothetical protein
MATWKKIIVSGSNISQLNNDAGYLTAGTVGLKNAFSTASFNGTALISDSTTGSLNFASSSGQGLTISANASTDTLTFGLAAIPNSSLLNSGSIIGNTVVNLGTTVTSLTGLTNVSSTSFTGSLQGTATTASYVVTAVNATNTAITDTTTGTGPYYLTFVAGTTGNQAQLVDSSTLSYNATTNTITATSSYANQALSASFASTAPYSGLTGVPTGIVSASSLGSANQGEVYITTNGVQQSAVDLGLQTTDNPTFAGATLGNITVGVTNDNTINTTSGDLTIQPNVVINSNLTVFGTASFQNTSNLQVADRFVLLASGSASPGDGGIVVQQGTQNVGELFGFDSGTSRWSVTSSFTADQGAYTPDAFMAAVTSLASTNPNTTGPATRYNASGNIFISSGDESIWIYS